MCDRCPSSRALLQLCVSACGELAHTAVLGRVQLVHFSTHSIIAWLYSNSCPYGYMPGRALPFAVRCV